MLDSPPPDDAPTLSASIEARRVAALDFLMGRINYERTAVVPYGQRQMKLDRMRQLLNRLGNPDAGLPIVHVAGTKGKGSTSALIAAMLHAAGYDTGLFSSPHLETIEERFAVNGLPCTAEDLVALVERLRPIVRAMDDEATLAEDETRGPTYFELTTAIALLQFVERQVDVAVLEVGLGGRLDSTNVCQPAVTVITSISFDHTRQLGNTLAEIAAEKAGIIKPGVPVLCGPLDPESQEVIARIAQDNGCRMIEAGRHFHYTYQPPSDLDQAESFGTLGFAETSDAAENQLTLPLRLVGEHQAANAALALATIEELRRQSWLISSAAMQAGLSSLALPGRVELLDRRPAVVLDVAHNVASATALAEVLRRCFDCRRRVLVLAVSRDKDVQGIVRALLPLFDRVIVTAYQHNPRAVASDALGQVVREQLAASHRDPAECQLFECPLAVDAWKLACQLAQPDELICVTGSFFIAAELRAAMRRCEPADA